MNGKRTFGCGGAEAENALRQEKKNEKGGAELHSERLRMAGARGPEGVKYAENTHVSETRHPGFAEGQLHNTHASTSPQTIPWHESQICETHRNELEIAVHSRGKTRPA